MTENLLKKTFTDKDFLRQSASIAVPVTLNLVLSTVTNMVDTMMIGTLGTVTISAVGLANKFFFVFSLLVFGVHSGTGLLMAQFFGNRDYLHIKKTFGLGIIINLSAALLFLLTAFLAPAFVMHLFTDSPEATAIGTRYLRLVCFCYPVFAFTSLMSSMLRSTRKVKIPVRAAMVSIVVNIFLNWCLIFGNLGFPELGVEGAAVATVIARIAECSILFWYSFVKEETLKGKNRDFFGWSKGFLKNFAGHSLPVIFNEMIWGLGTTLYFVAYGHIGDEAVAAITISSTITDIINTSGNGLSSAASVLLGNELGAGHLEKADDYAKKLLLLGALAGVVGAAVMIPLRRTVLSLFSVPDSVRADVALCLKTYLLILPMIMMNLITIVGILRAGGDTKMCFLIDTGGVWLLAVPMAFLGALVWKLPIYAIYGMVLLEEVFKCITGFLRYRKKVWLKNLADEI